MTDAKRAKLEILKQSRRMEEKAEETALNLIPQAQSDLLDALKRTGTEQQEAAVLGGVSESYVSRLLNDPQPKYQTSLYHLHRLTALVRSNYKDK